MELPVVAFCFVCRIVYLRRARNKARRTHYLGEPPPCTAAGQCGPGCACPGSFTTPTRMYVPRAIHGHRVRMRRTAPNFTGVEGAVENFTGLPTTRLTEQNPALCGIYFNRAIRAHGSPIDKEF
jgi:hypothetical protein